MKPIDQTQQPIEDQTDTTDNQASAHPSSVGIAPRWAAAVGAIAIGVLYLALPGHLTFGPSWLLLALEVPLLLPLFFARVIGRTLSLKTLRLLTLALLGVVTAALAVSIALLIITLPTNKQANILLRSAAILWCTNILVFALWYWEVDDGGPHKRHLHGHQAADFMFPQQVNGNDGSWAPHFVDYLFVAFTGATALSPADTYPMTRPAKLLMMTEAILSLIIIVLLAARAVNILGS